MRAEWFDCPGADLPGPVLIVARRATDHFGAAPVGELHGDVTDSAGCAMDEHRLPGAELGQLEECLPRRERGVRQSRSVQMIQ